MAARNEEAEKQEAEVTLEMIEAGYSELCCWDRDYGGGEMCAAIFSAMLEEQRRHRGCRESPR